MEYDRALFRVYDKIMEDLNSTPSPLFVTTDNNLALSPSSSTNRHDSRSFRQETAALSLIGVAAADGVQQQDGNAESNNEREIGEHPNSDSSLNEGDDNADNRDRPRDRPRDRQEGRPGGQRANRQGGERLTISTIAALQQRQRRRQHQPLPFLLPIWLARKVDQIIVNYRNRHYQHYSSLLPEASSEGTTSTAMTAYIYAAARLLWSISRELAMLGGGSGSRSRVDGLYDSIVTSPASTAAASEQHRDDISHDIELVLSSHHHHSPTNNIDDDDVEGGGNIDRPLSLDERSSSIDGLRRRSPNRHSSARDNRSEDVTTTNINDASLAIPNLSTALSSTSSASNTTPNSYSSNEDTGSDSDDTSSASSDDELSNTNERQRQRSNSHIHNNDDGGCSQLHLYGVMRLSLSIAIIHIFVLFALHVTYVGPYAFRDGNLRLRQQQQQQQQMLVTTASTASTQSTFANCISYALSDRPIGDRSKYMEKEDDPLSSDKRRRVIAMRDMLKNYIYNNNKKDRKRKFFSDPDDGTRYYHPRVLSESNSGNTSLTSDSILPTLGMDEILQIKIIYDGSCTGKCSRVHTVNQIKDHGDNLNAEEEDKLSLSIDDLDNKDVTASQASNNTNITMKILGDGKEVRQLSKQMDDINDQVKDDGSFSSPSYWEKVHYRFARGDALLHLDEKTVAMHNITYVNVTLTERCLCTGSDNGELTTLTAIGEALSQVYGMDSIIINQLMYGIRGTNGSLSMGYVQSMQTKERWGWSSEQLDEYEPHSFLYWMARKMGVLVMSAMAFFLITSVTSLIVRVLTSSGVVLMFPLFSLFREMGLPGADERILSQSYPWIGTARAAIGNQRIHPQSHLVAAHSFKIVLYYAMYEACEAAWSIILYNKSIPQGLPVWIFGFCMIWEYYSMVFVRSALSVHLFPRLALLYFISYHAYFYSVPYGFFDVALIPLFFFMMHAMLYTILALEAPNAARGVINVECPREVYNRLSWQEPVASLPAEWSIFLPLNSRVTSLHDRDTANGMAL